MPTLLEYNTEDFWSLPVAGTATLIGVGDSKTTDSSTNANTPYGLQRTLKSDIGVVGRMVRAEQGPPAWAGTITIDGGQGTAYNTQVGTANPSALTGAFAAGSIWNASTGPSPIASWTKIFTSNRDWFAPHEWKCALNDLSNYAQGDWTASKHVMARVIYYSTTNAVPNIRVQGYRGATLANTTVVNMAANPGTVQFAEVNCGNGAGTPEVRVVVDGTSSPNYDETGKHISILGVLFYAHNGSGTRLPGLTFANMATGGLSTATLLTNIGGGTPLVDDARVIEWLNAVRAGTVSHFMVDIGQNAAGTEIADLDAGNYTGYKNAVGLVCTRLRAMDPNCKILLMNPRAAAYSAINNTAKGTALLELARERNLAFYDFYQEMGRQASGNHPVTADGTHSSTNGAITEGAVISGGAYRAAANNRRRRVSII